MLDILPSSEVKRERWGFLTTTPDMSTVAARPVAVVGSSGTAAVPGTRRRRRRRIGPRPRLRGAGERRVRRPASVHLPVAVVVDVERDLDVGEGRQRDGGDVRYHHAVVVASWVGVAAAVHVVSGRADHRQRRISYAIVGERGV